MIAERFSIPTFRVAGQLAVALLALLIPDVGEHRHYLAGAIIFISAPIALIINIYWPSSRNGWIEPFYDLTLVVTLVHFVPNQWFIALCVGLMVALAPSVNTQPNSHRIYTLYACVLVGGMTFAAWWHEVTEWQLPMLVITLLYPSVIYYARWQAKRTERLQQHASQLASLQQLAGSVAHDFNNVLTGISGHTELALLALEDKNAAQRSLAGALAGVQRASLLCNQLLTFAGRGVSTQGSINLNQELTTIVGLMQTVVPKGVALTLNVPKTSIDTWGDRAALQQVFMNVILNAGEANQAVPAEITIDLSARA